MIYKKHFNNTSRLRMRTCKRCLDFFQGTKYQKICPKCRCLAFGKYKIE